MIGNLNSIFKQKIKLGGGAPVYDADALAYFTANTSITSDADKNAINTFYLGLKSDGIYTKIKAMYLPIWGSAASCKWNLKDPRDLDAAFRLTFATGMTFTSSGMTSNGTSGYANTFLNPRINLSVGNQHVSIYSRTNTIGAINDIGCGTTEGGGDFYTLMRIRSTGDLFLISMGNTSFPTASNNDAKGFYLMSKNTTTTASAYKNNTKIINEQSVSTSEGNNNIAICGLNYNGTVTQFTTRQYTYISIGNKLTDTEASNFYTRVNTLMTYFGINV